MDVRARACRALVPIRNYAVIHAVKISSANQSTREVCDPGAVTYYHVHDEGKAAPKKERSSPARIYSKINIINPMPEILARAAHEGRIFQQ